MKESLNIRIDGLAAIRDKLSRYEEEVLMTVSDRLRFAALRIYAEILTRAPVDTGRYRAAWSAPEVESGQHVVRAHISNSVEYARPVTFGSPKGGKPWPKAGPRTLEHAGRIYAKGGLRDESLAKGGVVTPLFEGWADAAVKEILHGLDQKGLP